ncbi:MAG: ribonuclease HII [Firmicutes bacterium]|nr:ribonuclease HII [Bacillota bacterium]
MYEIEDELFAQGRSLIAGVDEVGRGSWAGPVAVGVVMANRGTIYQFPEGITDSKLLTPSRRKTLAPKIMAACSAFGVGYADNEECDDLGMTKAQALATSRAIKEAGLTPDQVLLDGKFNFTELDNVINIIKGDSKSILIAAASIIAKVARDDLMIGYGERFPGYGFEKHKGYPSLFHRDAVQRMGLSSMHRKSWHVTRLDNDEKIPHSQF